MSTSGHPGRFVGTLVSVSNRGLVCFKAEPEAVEYLKKQIALVGTVDWNPNSYKPNAGDTSESPS